MKKLKSFICMLVLMCSAVCLYACKGKDDKATLTDATTNLKEFYYITESIDWTDVKVTAKYSDKTTKTLTKGQFDIPVEDANADTEWVLDTNGLKAETAGALTEKEYNLTLYIVGTDKTYPFTITVDENESHAFEIGRFELPENIQTFNHNISTNANGFKVTQNAQYYVGDDNSFDITPVYDVYKIGSNDDYDINISLDVEVWEGNTKVDSEVYSYADGKIDFTEDAIGKTYTIKIKPKYFNQTRTGNIIQQISFDVAVKDGYNAYNAYDLGMMSIAPEGVNYDNYRCTDSSRAIFYNPETSSYSEKKTHDIWQSFLTEKGYEDISYIKNIFIHNDIEINKDNLPTDFFITSQESSDGFATGKLRDWSFIYSHFMQDDFTMEGNYFTIDASELPVNGSLDKTVYTATSRVNKFGHSKLFNFLGMSVQTNNTVGSNQKVAYVKNVSTIGNTNGIIAGNASDIVEGQEGVDASKDIALAAGGIIMFQNASCSAEIDNINIYGAMIGLFTEMTDSATTYEAGTTTASANAHLQTTTMTHANIANCFNSAIFSWGGEGGIDITYSTFKNFGGPAIFITGRNDKEEGQQHIQHADCTYDDTVEIENWIGGGEAWFAINGATGIVTTLKQLDSLFNYYGKTFLDNNQKVNLKVLVMDYKYLKSTNKELLTKVNQYDFLDSRVTAVNNQGAPFVWTNGNAGTSSLPDNMGYIYASDKNNLSTYCIKNLDNNTRTTALTGDEVCISYPISSTASAGIIMDMENYTPQA